MKYVIIGGGPAGIYAAKTISETDTDAEIKIFTEEDHFFYSRPKLTLQFLADKCSKEELCIFDKNWFAEKNITFHKKTKVCKINPEKKEIETTTGITETYDKLLIATGSVPRKLPVTGADNKKVMTIRTIEDIEQINQYAKSAKRCVVVGGGLLGLETANALLNKNIDVHVLEFFDRLMPRQTDQRSSEILQNILTEKGLVFHLGQSLDEIKEKDNELILTTQKGLSLTCDFVIMSAGIAPSSQLAKDCQIKTDKAICSNTFLETSIPDIYAAGDCLEFEGRIYGFWTAAMEQGVIAGKNMCGEKIPYSGSTISATVKVADVQTASLGSIEEKDNIATFEKESDDNQKYLKIFLENDILIGAVMIGSTKKALSFKKLIQEKQIIENPNLLLED